MTDLPTVKHGFMGRLVKEISFTTEEQYDSHIVKLLNILAEGGHILVSTTVSMFFSSFLGSLIHQNVFFSSSKQGELVNDEFPQIRQSTSNTSVTTFLRWIAFVIWFWS